MNVSSAAKTPLPPINKTPPPPESAHESIKEVPDETENQFKVTVETLEEDDKEAADTEKEAVNDEDGGDAFFMTQVMHRANLARNPGIVCYPKLLSLGPSPIFAVGYFYKVIL